MHETKQTEHAFRLPRYHEIPNVGLYLEQTARYIGECLAPLLDGVITTSMISNYVKRGLVSNPVKKQYSREQIADLMYIAAVKTVLSMEDIRLMLRIQRENWETKMTYNYFCDSLEAMLTCVAEEKQIPEIPKEESSEKVLLHNTIVALAYTVSLRKQLAAMQEENTTKKAD